MDVCGFHAGRIRIALSVWLFMAGAATAQVPTRAPGWLPQAAEYQADILAGEEYEEGVPTPAQILGFPYGARAAKPDEIELCLRVWEPFERIELVEYARTHEQRPLYYAVITSKANHARIDAIRTAIGKLAYPRELSGDAEARTIINETPAVAWLAYSIHGDELSGADAAVGVIYHLIACKDADVRALLDELVVIVDPMMNPDGRNRILHMLDQAGGYTPNLDASAVQHDGRWPYGRGNHYLFDLNRDWLPGVHPETRGRQRAIAAWHPQLLVDAHEMGSNDTYLFNPPRMPFNPHLPATMRKWWDVFADEQAAAFDEYGWSYYSREWLEFWYPGYSDAWACFHGAIGILYEQAGTGGSPIRQRSGKILAYREAVHHQFVSSLANLNSLKQHRQEVLRDYLAEKRRALRPPDGASEIVFVLPSSENESRTRAFLSNLHNQGIEIGVAQHAFAARDGKSTLGKTFAQREFPAGTVVVSRQQPLGALVMAALDFDTRTSDEFLAWERRELETKRESKVYDVTAWSLPMSFGLEAYWCGGVDDIVTQPYKPAEKPAGAVQTATEDATTYGYVIDGRDDAVHDALAYLLMADVTVRVAEKGFTANGRRCPRGSLLIRMEENRGADLPTRLEQAARSSGLTVRAVITARSPDEGPDLGGEHFIQLVKPRVALFGGAGVDFTSYGSIWHLLDHEVGLPVSLLDPASLFRVDSRDYNVLILPDTFGSAERIYKPLVEQLKDWVRNGGTLIAVGSAAAYLADEEVGLSQARLRRDVLGQIDAYARAVARERSAGKTPPDPQAVWETSIEPEPATQPTQDGDGVDADEDQRKERDEWRRIFSPTGVIVRGELDTEHWITFGCAVEMPLFAAGSRVLMSKQPVQTPVRLAERGRLRLSGLLWPEAATRMADSAYLTVERVGSGQVILFAHEPDFRGAWHGTRRLLVNAVLLGPGCGTSQPMNP